MWMKSKQILNPHFRSGMNPFNNSCEEQAFADDAAGPLGGFIWPPRSYSCTFCKREFRSAQALGGHMNVHRRDRARLKQSLTPQSEVLHHPCKSSDASNPSQVWFLDSNPIFVASPHSSSRASAISTQENLSEPTHFSPFCSSIVQEHLKPAFGKKVRKEDFSSSIVETNLSMGLNLVVSQNRPSGLDCDEVTTCKRHKAAVSPMPFFVKHKTGSLEDLDLELRLGDPPKVK